MKTLFLTLAVLVSACGRPQWPGDPELYGVDLQVEHGKGMAAYVDAPDFKSRVRNIIQQTAASIGRDPQELAGLRLVFVPTRFDCDVAPKAGCVGLYDSGENTMYVAASASLDTSPRCPEDMQLPHEMVHYFIGDPDHHSAYFGTWYFKDLWRTLHEGTECADFATLYVGQWSGGPPH